MPPLRFLVTGGTGFLGKHVLPELRRLAGPNGVVDCISRTQPDCIRGDLTRWDAQLDPESLSGRYDVFLHMAGLYDLRVSRSEGLKHNVTATHTALTLAQKARIPRFVHISTVAVTVGERGTANEIDLKRVGLDSKDPLIFPDILDTNRAFPDEYARTKAYAENLVKHWPTGDFRSTLNLRLGVLVGDTEGHAIDRIDGPYHIPEFLKRSRKWIDAFGGKLPFPGNPKTPLPLVPVDAAARAIARLIERSVAEDWREYRSLHLFPGNGPKIDEVYASALASLGFAQTTPSLASRVPKPIVKRLGEWISDIPREELEYILSFPRLDVSETEALLGREWCPEFKSYEKAFWKGYHAYVSDR